MSIINLTQRKTFQSFVPYNQILSSGLKTYPLDYFYKRVICKDSNQCIFYTLVYLDEFVDQNNTCTQAEITIRRIDDVTDGADKLGFLNFINGSSPFFNTETIYGSGTVESTSSNNYEVNFSSLPFNRFANVIPCNTSSFPNTEVRGYGVPDLTYTKGDPVWVGTGKESTSDGKIVNSGFFSPADPQNDQLIELTGFVFAETKTLNAASGAGNTRDFTIAITKA